MATFISRSPEETFALGERWGREGQAGWVFALTGNLGCGKTELVKGIARGLAVNQRVHSPTFSLVHTYRGGRLPLFHLDLYRLETAEQVVGAGLEDYIFQSEGVTAVEWAERWFDSFSGRGSRVQGSMVRRVRMEVLSEKERRIDYEDLVA